MSTKPPATVESLTAKAFDLISTAQRNGMYVSDAVAVGIRPFLEEITELERERDSYAAAGIAEYDGAQAARRGVSIEDCPYGPNKPDGFRDSTLMGMWQKGHDLVTRAKRIEELEAALLRILAEPDGCPFCDSGKLRTPDNPAKGHNGECGFFMAQKALGIVSDQVSIREQDCRTNIELSA